MKSEFRTIVDNARAILRKTANAEEIEANKKRLEAILGVAPKRRLRAISVYCGEETKDRE